MRIAPRQIDRLVARAIGAGSTTTSSFDLPHARYTVFVEYDHPDAVVSFALVDRGEGPVPSENAVGAQRPGDVSAPIVQQELKAGTYEFEISTLTSTCSWDVQVVLNTMLSWRRPPPAWRPTTAPPQSITIRTGDDPVFLLSQTGRYEADWTVGSTKSGHVMAPHSVDLRAAGGQVVNLGSSDGKRGHRSGCQFLGAGQWTVEMKADLEWEFVLAPVTGPTGGGARAF